MNLSAEEQHIIGMLRYMGNQAGYLKQMVGRLKLPDDAKVIMQCDDLNKQLADLSERAANAIARIEQIAKEREEL